MSNRRIIKLPNYRIAGLSNYQIAELPNYRIVESPNYQIAELPNCRIIELSNRPQVYLVEKGKAVLRDITVTARTKNKAVVGAGLTEGDVMITGGFINLFDGANVNVK